MVARARVLSLLFVSMLVLSALPGVVPVASADHAGNLTINSVEILVGGNPATSLTPTLKSSDGFAVRITVASGSYDGCTYTGVPPTAPVPATLSATADLTAFGLSEAESLGSTQSESAPSGAVVLTSPVLTVAPTATKNGEAVTVTADVTLSCSSGVPAGAAHSDTKSKTSGNSVKVDNTPPTGTVSASWDSGTSGKIGSTLTLTVGGNDVVSAEADLRKIGYSSPQTLSVGANTFLVKATSASDAGFPISVSVYDAAGNQQTPTMPTITVDAVRPSTLSAKIIPRADGVVDIRFNTPTDSDAAGFVYEAEIGRSGQSATTYNLADPPFSSISSDPPTYRLAAPDIITKNEVWGFRVRATDAAGNPGLWTDTIQVTPADNPSSVSMNEPDDIIGAWPTLTGDWGSAVDVNTLSDPVRVALKDSTGKCWDFATTDFDTCVYTSSYEPATLTPATGLSGTWSFAGLSSTADTLPSGTYTIEAIFLLDGQPTSTHTATVSFDAENPIAEFTADEAIVSTDLTLQQGQTPIKVRAGFDGTGTDIDRIEAHLVRIVSDGDGGSFREAVAHVYDENEIVMTTCRPGQPQPLPACSIADETLVVDDDPITVPVATFAIGGAPLSTYQLTLVAYDKSGRSVTVESEQDITIIPRVTLDQTEDRLPFASGAGLRITPYAAWDAFSNHQPRQDNCASAGACRVSRVEIRAKEVGQEDTAAKVLGNVLTYSRGAGDWTGSGIKYYDYTPSSLLDLQGLNAEILLVQARAVVTFAEGDPVTASTGWTRVQTSSTPPFMFLQPAQDFQVFARGAKASTTTEGDPIRGDANFTVYYQRAALGYVPTLKYDVQVLDVPGADKTLVGKYISFDDSSVDPSSDPIVHTIEAGSQTSFAYVEVAEDQFHFYNLSNQVNLGSGIYRITAQLFDSAGAELGSAIERTFAVETQKPSVTVEYNQVDVVGDEDAGRSFVNASFNYEITIHHHYANVTPDLVFPSVLVPATDGLSMRRVLPGTDNFQATLLYFNTTPDDKTTAVYRIRLPYSGTSGPADGSRFELTFEASSDMYNGSNEIDANGTETRVLIVDGTGATARYDELLTSDSSQDITSDLLIVGTAQDHGSGVERVEVRIIEVNDPDDPSDDRTFWPDAFAFRKGTWEYWMTTERVRHPSGEWREDVQLVGEPDSQGRIRWVVNANTRAKLNDAGDTIGQWSINSIHRGTTYQIQVRAWDALGLVPSVDTQETRLDLVPPTILDNVLVGQDKTTLGDGSGIVLDSFDSTHVLGITVRDNHCVASVRLKALTPVSKVPIELPFKPDGYTCPATAKGDFGNAQNGQWILDLADAPNATAEVGEYHYGVVVEDLAGNLRESLPSQNLTLVVRDTFAPVVEDLITNPEPAIQGLSANMRAYVRENGGVENVTIHLTRRLAGGQLQYLGNGSASPLQAGGNGTGIWEIESTLIKNATGAPVRLLDGSYYVNVQVVDTALLSINETFLLQVIESDVPAVQLVGPANNSVVNATPIVRFRAAGLNLTQSGISVLAGNSTENLTEVNRTELAFQPLPEVDGNSTGFEVAWQPEAAVPGGNLTVRLRVVNERGLDNVTTITYAVDDVPPTLNVNVTGERVIDNVSYAVNGTRVTVNATNATSVTYRVGAGSPLPYTTSVTPTGSDGAWAFVARATDAAGNAVEKQVSLQIDRTGPTISVVKAGDEMVVTVRDVSATQQPGVGVDTTSVAVHYAYGASPTFTRAAMAPLNGTENAYTVTLPGNATETGLRYSFEAKDRLDNVRRQDNNGLPYEIRPNQTGDTNLPPTVRITAPVNGATIPRTTTITWTAVDPEGGDISVDLTLLKPDGSSELLLDNEDNTGSYALNATTFAAGSYTLTLTASDGVTLPQSATAQFLLERAPVVEVRNLPPPSATVGSPVTFSVAVSPEAGKVVGNVTYSLTRDGAPYANGTMRLLQGIYFASYTPEEGGDYAVSVGVTYTDGTSAPAQRIGAFTVPGGEGGEEGAGGAPMSFIMLLVVAALTIALAAYGAFVRWK